MKFLLHVGLLMVMVLGWDNRSSADAVLFAQEPYGAFGAVNPTGHASVYLSRVCADTPVILRRCRPGELGIVISRYRKIHGYDWLAVPLLPYLYAVGDVASIPSIVDSETVALLRNEYRREHLQSIVPDLSDGQPPKGSWIELVGASYNRKIYGFKIQTTEAQDDRLITVLNSRENKSHFNLFFNNCADFSGLIFNFYYPGIIRRNYVADAGMTTPRQIAKCLVTYAKHHPEFSLSVFVLPQIPGYRHPSHRIEGVTEGFVRSKKYILPLALFHPWIAGGVLALYLAQGRFNLARYAETDRSGLEFLVLQDFPYFAVQDYPYCRDIAGGEKSPWATDEHLSNCRGIHLEFWK